MLRASASTRILNKFCTRPLSSDALRRHPERHPTCLVIQLVWAGVCKCVRTHLHQQMACPYWCVTIACCRRRRGCFIETVRRSSCLSAILTHPLLLEASVCAPDKECDECGCGASVCVPKSTCREFTTETQTRSMLAKCSVYYLWLSGAQ